MSDQLAVIGAGNGGAAAAAELSLLGHGVVLFNRSPGRLQPFEGLGGVHLINEDGDHGIVPIARITTSLEEALGDSETVIVMVPTSGLRYYATEMAPHLRSDHVLLLAPGHTGGALQVRRILEEAGAQLPRRLGETNTLPYVCRMTHPGEVTIWRHSQSLLTAALPATESEPLCAHFTGLFAENRVIETTNVLETSLSNYNAVMHPAGMILNAGWIEKTGGAFRYYAEGHGPAVGRVIGAVDSERLEIGRAFGLDLTPFLDAFYQSGYTTEEAWRSGRIDLAISASEANKEIQAPSSLSDRYIEEDVGFGLVPMMHLAAAAGVVTRAIDTLVGLTDIATGEGSTVMGLTAADMGIEGLSKQQLLSYVETGDT